MEDAAPPCDADGGKSALSGRGTSPQRLVYTGFGRKVGANSSAPSRDAHSGRGTGKGCRTPRTRGPRRQSPARLPAEASLVLPLPGRPAPPHRILTEPSGEPSDNRREGPRAPRKGGGSGVTSLPLPARRSRPRWSPSGRREKLVCSRSGRLLPSLGGLLRAAETGREPGGPSQKRGLEGQAARGRGRPGAGPGAGPGPGAPWLMADRWGEDGGGDAAMEMLLTKAFLSSLSLTLAMPVAMLRNLPTQEKGSVWSIQPRLSPDTFLWSTCLCVPLDTALAPPPLTLLCFQDKGPPRTTTQGSVCKAPAWHAGSPGIHLQHGERMLACRRPSQYL